MKLTVICPDSVVMVDGVPVIFDFKELMQEIETELECPPIWAVQWDGKKGHVEFVDKVRPNTPIDNIDVFQPIVAAHGMALADREAERIQAEADRLAVAEAAKTYKEKRMDEYPSVGDQLEVIWIALEDSTNPDVVKMRGKIQEVKDKYPKPAE